jgi:hypothetical protein
MKTEITPHAYQQSEEDVAARALAACFRILLEAAERRRQRLAQQSQAEDGRDPADNSTLEDET